MEIFEALDATECAHSAAQLAGVDPKTVRRYARMRDAGRPVAGPVARPKLIDPFMPKIEEWVERSQARVRADKLHERLVLLGFAGEERTTGRAVSRAKERWNVGHAGRYHCSVSTMYRILRDKGQSGERRRQATHPAKAVPELVATASSQVFTWDITKLAGPAKGNWYHAYVIIDIISRYIVGHTMERAESAERAEELIRDTIERNGIVPETVHADRGTSMTSKKVSQLLIDLGVTRSHSRPKVSNDNPYSEAQFKTTKYMSDYTERFDSLAHAREWFDALTSYYNHEHRHSGSAGTRLPASTSAPPRRSATSAPSPSPRHTPGTPNASAAAPHHPRYRRKRGSTTPPNAGNQHQRSHSTTNVSLDLKSSDPGKSEQ
ncbi:DDE-type integrase/transposase/recombinase [Streptomyces hokutonensis]|uniref:DDE-type integrase/transposase/recombinase n=1 Tax=Streptomyces hokutonensis TaxID=1306990 RepID=A0ABW6M7R1_9ACTN